MATHLDWIYQEIILGIILHRAKLEYCRLKQRIISNNLLFAINDSNSLITDLENQIIQGQLIEGNKLGEYFICSFLELAPKSNEK